jgi:hypothetical protein
MSGTGSGRTTRPASIRGSPIVSLVGLSNQEVQTIKDEFGIRNLDDIATLEKEDFNTVLGEDNSSFMKRRRLFQVSIYLLQRWTYYSNSHNEDYFGIRSFIYNSW